MPPDIEAQATAPQPEPQVAAQPEPAAAPNPEPTGAEPAAPSPAPAPNTPPWYLREISRLRGELREAKATPGAQTQPVAQPVAPANGVVTLTQAELEAQINNAANARAAQQRFNDECNDFASKGKTAHPDFMNRVEALRTVDDGERYGALLSAALSLRDQGTEVMYRLGGNLEEAARVLALAPMQMGMELVKLSGAPPVSPVLAAPVPGVVGSRGTTHIEITASDARSDALPMSEWMKRREAEVKENNKRGLRML